MADAGANRADQLSATLGGANMLRRPPDGIFIYLVPNGRLGSSLDCCHGSGRGVAARLAALVMVSFCLDRS
jgi:hypothetical protein